MQHLLPVAAAIFATGLATPALAEPATGAVAGPIWDCHAQAARPMDYPRHARPGECFEKAHVDATFDVFDRRVMTTRPHREVHLIPAVYGWADRQVMVTPGRIERREIPATYRQVTDTVVVTPGYVREERSEPIYGLDFEQVMVRPAGQVWRRVAAGDEAPDGARRDADGDIFCLVSVPAEYVTRERRVVRVPGRVTEIRVAALTRDVTREVVDQPAHIEITTVAAVYRTQRVRQLVTPRHVEVTHVAASYATHEWRREVAPAHDEWRKIDCAPRAASSHDADPMAPPGHAPLEDK